MEDMRDKEELPIKSALDFTYYKNAKKIMLQQKYQNEYCDTYNHNTLRLPGVVQYGLGERIQIWGRPVALNSVGIPVNGVAGTFGPAYRNASDDEIAVPLGTYK